MLFTGLLFQVKMVREYYLSSSERNMFISGLKMDFLFEDVEWGYLSAWSRVTVLVSKQLFLGVCRFPPLRHTCLSWGNLKFPSFSCSHTLPAHLRGTTSKTHSASVYVCVTETIRTRDTSMKSAAHAHAHAHVSPKVSLHESSEVRDCYVIPVHTL